MQTSARLLRLLSLLQTPREWTGGELAERLGVSPRTIRHDVERLRDLGYPVHGTRGPAGGYRLSAGAAMPPLLLDDAEAVAVVIGLRTAVGGAVSGAEEASLRALAKLEQVLPARLRSRVRTLSSVTMAVPPVSPASAVDPEVLTAVAVASDNHERVRFTYTGFDGTASEREVEPYRLVNWGRRWYLVGYDTGRSDWRTFRVDRVVPRTPGGGRFTPRPLPSADLAEWVSRRVSAAVWRYRAKVTVFAPAAVVQARTRGLAGTVTPVNDTACVLDTGSDDAATLAVYLGMLGCDFRVDEPPELAAAVRELADRYRRAAL